MKKAILIFVLALSVKCTFAQVTVNQSQISICAGSSTLLAASEADSYFWSPSAGLNTSIGSSVTASPQVSTTYTVTGFDLNGNSSEASVVVVVNLNPVINLNIVQPSACNYINGLYINPIYQDIKVSTDIVYGQNYYFNGQLKDLKLDIYQPEQLVNYKRPAILVLHGGGFLFGNKEDSIVVALSHYFAARGYVVYNANYRTGMTSANQANAGKAYYRAVQDAKSCVRYIRKTGTDIGVDTAQIFMAGVSAGALTSIGTAYLDQNEIPAFINYSTLGLLEDASGNVGYSSKVSGVVSISGGVYDTTTIFDNETEPLYSFHGTEDGVIPYYSGLVGGQVLTYGGYSVNKAAVQNGLNSTLHTFIGGGHVPPLASIEMDSIFSESNSFLYSLVNFKNGENSCASIFLNGNAEFNWFPESALSNFNSKQLIAYPSALTNYTLTATDSNGCIAQSVVEIKSADQLQTTIKIDTVFKYLNLQAVVNINESTANYLWSNGATTFSINHVSPGNYSVTVFSDGCQQSTEKEILYPELITATDMSVEYVTSCHVKFNWKPMPHSLYQKVLLTNIDDTIKQQIFLIHGEDNYEYTDLVPWTNYKFEITAYTWNDSTAGSAALNFKSKPCEMPIEFVNYNIGSDHGSIEWNGACNPESYRFKYRESGAAIWQLTGTATEQVTLNNLSPGTTYEYFVRTICVSGSAYSKKSDLSTFTTQGQKIENAAYTLKQNINVFPNPSNGNFTLKAAVPENYRSSVVEIINNLGQVVYRLPVQAEDGNIDVAINLGNNLLNGVYELRIKTGNDYLKTRFVVK